MDSEDWFIVAMVAVIVAFVITLGFFLHKQTQKDLQCKEWCTPYQNRMIDGDCACMDDEKRWVMQ